MSAEQMMEMLVAAAAVILVGTAVIAWVVAEREERAWRRRWEQTKRRMERNGE